MSFGEILALDDISNPYPRSFTITYSLGDSGSIVENIKEGESRDIELYPPDGFDIYSLTLNGIEQEYELTHSHISLKSVTENKIIRIIYRKNSESCVKDNCFIPHKVVLRDKEVIIEGKFTTACLYSLDGKMLYQGNSANVRLPMSGVFVLKVDEAVYKFSVN